MTDYELLTAQAEALLESDSAFVPFLSNLSALIKDSMEDINWAGFYLLRGDILTVGPFQGHPACVHIEVGRGVCGTAVKEMRSILVKDVHAFQGHIACDAASASEIVVPIRDAGGKIRGVLDIDSPSEARFTEKDQEGLEMLCGRIGGRIRWEEAQTVKP